MKTPRMNTPRIAFRIAFRTDASLDIGTGHVMRCLTLADALCARGATAHFICRAHDGHLMDLIHARGHQVTALPRHPTGQADTTPLHARWLGTDWATDARETLSALNGPPADWLVVDHYALDARWENALRPACQRLMVIDDLADRPHHGDLLLDQNLGRAASDYVGLVPTSCAALTGPRYALLRPEFAARRAQSLARRNPTRLHRLLVTLGGVDKDNATTRVLQALRHSQLPASCQITVVMGPHAPWLAEVQIQAAQMPWATGVLVSVNHMAELMAQSDLAIGAAGSTNWERCCLGLPCLLLVLADNQQSSARALQQAQAVRVMDLASLSQALPRLVAELSVDPNADRALAALSSAAQAITDGQGAELVARQMLPMTQPSAQARHPARETC